MGVDIHLYIEYSNSDSGFRTAPTSQKQSWLNFGRDIRPTRHRDIFARLAGTLGNPEDCLVFPRGIPEDCGPATFYDYWICVVDEKDEHEVEFDDFEFKMCSPKDAESFVRSKSSQQHEILGESGEKLQFVSDPDLFSPSWLSRTEYAAAIAGFDDVLYDTVLLVMEHLEKSGYEPRVVFWFDR